MNQKLVFFIVLNLVFLIEFFAIQVWFEGWSVFNSRILFLYLLFYSFKIPPLIVAIWAVNLISKKIYVTLPLVLVCVVIFMQYSYSGFDALTFYGLVHVVNGRVTLPAYFYYSLLIVPAFLISKFITYGLVKCQKS